MARYEAYECDECGREERADVALMWIRTEVIGVDITAMGDKLRNGDFCSPKCLRGYFKNVK